MGTNPQLFFELPGGPEIIEWCGFCPSFHDSTLVNLELKNGSAKLRLTVFRTTSEIDTAGYFVLDRHANISFELSGVTGLSLNGDAQSILDELVIRKVQSVASDWSTCQGPQIGDYELNFSTHIGLEGVLFARQIKMFLEPSNAPA